MKRIFAVAVCGVVAMAAGCASTKTDASAGMVAGEKKCCASEAAGTDKAKAAPGMVAGEKKECGAAKAGCSASSSCSEKKMN
jgi:hypothetical protein